jgi:hypothetical protein
MINLFTHAAARSSCPLGAFGFATPPRAGPGAGTGRAAAGTGGFAPTPGLAGIIGFGFGAGGGPLLPMTDDGREFAGDEAPETATKFFCCQEGAAAGAGGGARLTGAGAGGGGGGGAALGAGSRLDVSHISQ